MRNVQVGVGWVCFRSPKYQLETETSPFMLIPALKLSQSSHCSLIRERVSLPPTITFIQHRLRTHNQRLNPAVERKYYNKGSFVTIILC